MANESRESNGGLTVKVDVDVSDALTGLKALRREADACVRSLKQLDDTMQTRLTKANEMLAVQGDSGNWNYSPYMHGMYNGMEFLMSVLENREPAFRDAPSEWLCDKVADYGDLIAGSVRK